MTMITNTSNNEKKPIRELNTDDLNAVSGGFLSEVVHDSAELKELGLLDRTVGDIYTLSHWDESTAFVEAGWAKIGITCVTRLGSHNFYYYQGKELRRDDALEFAKKACIKGPQIKQKI